MSLLDTFRGLVATEELATGRIDECLRRLYRGFLARAKRLDSTADRAPSRSSEDELRKLADDHRQAAERLRSALLARSASIPSGSEEMMPANGFSHWARIVDDLGVLQDGHAEILDVAAEVAEHSPELPELFDTLTRTSADLITRLRGQIARADPQALN